MFLPSAYYFSFAGIPSDVLKLHISEIIVAFSLTSVNIQRFPQNLFLFVQVNPASLLSLSCLLQVFIPNSLLYHSGHSS